MSKPPEIGDLARSARHLLQSMADAGISALPRAPGAVGMPRRGGSTPGGGAPQGRPTAPGARGIPAAPEHSDSEKKDRLEPVRQQALICQRCRLCKTRTQVVFGEGSLDAPLVFVGEGPGREEDLQGRPFVGAAGQLLTKMIEAMKLKREEVYIANVVKCRPPNNRPPEPDEIAACHEYLSTQLQVIRPRVICALGKTAAATLLETTDSMGSLRGKTFSWKEIPLIITYHPAYLLRNPPAKKLVWEDLQRVLALLKEG